MFNYPKVSVIIPTYNYAQFIGEAIDSVLSQDYSLDKIEIIVVDDGSNDGTKEALKGFIDSNVIKYYYQQNKGKANATYFAIQKATGKYIFNLDADDYYFPSKISKSVSVFESDANIVHVSNPAKVIHSDNQGSYLEQLSSVILAKPLNGNWLLKYFLDNNMLFGGGSTYAAKTSVLKSLNIADSIDMYIDEFLVLAILPFGKSFFIEQPLSAWRVHSSNYSSGGVNYYLKLAKSQRLLSSSTAVLSYVQRSNFDEDIIKLYRLKDLTRRIAFKEYYERKNFKDIINYAFEVFFDIKPGWNTIRKYNVLNRLIPYSLLLQLKGIVAKIK